MAERSTSDLSADADAYLAKFDPAQAGENDPDKGGQAYLDRFDPSVVGQRPIHTTRRPRPTSYSTASIRA